MMTQPQADKMLDAAARLFGAHRFHEVRMEDIAVEAGVGKGTIYRYFADKDELYVALLARSSEQFVRRVASEVARATGARARLEALVASVLSFFDAQPHLLDLIQRAEVLRGPGADFPWQRTRDEMWRLTDDLFEEARKSREFTIRDPELAARMLLGGLRSVIRFGKTPRAADLPHRIVEDFLSGAALRP
jgi:TetR/AcrR family fatty acid metabolism transcriptional regulator